MRSRRPRCSTTTLEAVVITASSKGGWRRWVWTWAGAPPGQGIRWRVAPNTLVHLYEGGRLLPGVNLGAPKAHPIMGPSGSSSPSCRRSPEAALRREPPVTHARHCTPSRGSPGAAPIMGPLATTPHSGTSRPALLPDNAPRYGAALEQHPSWGRSPGRRTLARAARHSSGSSSHHGAARQDAALWPKPPGTHARQRTPSWGRPGAAPIMGPLGNRPHSCASRPALAPASAPREGGA